VVATFFDTGAVTIENLNVGGADSFTHQLQYAFGLGLRYLTPIGPIRVDFAYRPNFGPPLPVQTLTPLPPPVNSGCFGLGKGRANSGGAPEGQCTIQLSIGEAF
jgi:translocation and assembly module TamA